MPLTLAEINAADRDTFVALLAGTYEHSPWVAEVAWPKRPFTSLAALKLGIGRNTITRKIQELGLE